MIISASRRTDIPAFYSRWFINRIRDGYCLVPNPFNKHQINRISLTPADVDVIVFWSRNPRPLFSSLRELNEAGYRYYFQFTLLDYPAMIDRHSPSVFRSLDTFRELAEKIGPERVVWRYDPIVLSEITSFTFHTETYDRLSQALKGYTTRSVISFLDLYPKIRRRMAEIESQGGRLLPVAQTDQKTNPEVGEKIGDFVSRLAHIASANGIEIVSCAEKLDLQPYGVRPGKCIDDELIQKVFGLRVSPVKDPGQRTKCGCVISKDIGMYDSCLFDCRYCYATSSFERARLNYSIHDPESPSLLVSPE